MKEIKNDDIIIYFGKSEDKLLFELSLRYLNFNKIILIEEFYSENEIIYKNTEIISKDITPIFYKRFNLIQKAKESNVFGIIVGGLSIYGLNQILDELKYTLKTNQKKCYTFLLGKITLEKLSNFVDYIDCFILIACPFSDFYEFKTLYKPMVSPLDIKIAFDSNYKWEMIYSFDANYILEKNSKNISEELEKLRVINNSENKENTHTGIKLLE